MASPKGKLNGKVVCALFEQAGLHSEAAIGLAEKNTGMAQELEERMAASYVEERTEKNSLQAWYLIKMVF